MGSFGGILLFGKISAFYPRGSVKSKKFLKEVACVFVLLYPDIRASQRGCRMVKLAENAPGGDQMELLPQL